MRAALLREYGPPDNLRVEEVACPPVGPHDVKVQVHASSLNPVDWKCRSGTQRAIMGWKLPWVQGLDLAGEVVEVGPAVTSFAVGDAVWGSPNHKRWGAWAEACVVHEAELGHKPPSLSFAEAASIPLAGQTAWQCLVPHVREGSRVFIQAGSGGVGTLAIQIAKARGAWVATTCSEPNHPLVRKLGADLPIDYRSARWWEVLEDLDLILDALGGEERDRALQAVKRGGRVASITSGLPGHARRYGPWLGTLVAGVGIGGFWLGGKLRGVDAANVVRSARRDILDALAAMVEDGSLRPVIDRTYPLEHIAEAHRYGETGRIRGKVVLTVRD